ncbi:MAG: O-antigen ligase family protein, partial [Acidobacteria bacterium]|nr:O-antigen ligase family protein [Acidobacteriota bacterium]
MALCGIVFYPIPAFLSLESLPVAVRAAWILIPVAAWIWPWWSLLGFLVVAPLVPTLPAWFGWPLIAPAEILLFGILLPALLRKVISQDAGSHDSGATRPALVLAAIATSSLIVVLYPLHLTTDGIGALLRQIHDFARTDLIVAQSQNHFFGSLTAWAMLIEGLAVMWMVLVNSPDRGSGKSIAQLVTAAAAGATLVAALGVAQWWTGHGLLPFWLQQNPNITRINATFTDVNGLGSYLAMMVPIVLGLAMRRAGLSRVSWRAAAVLLMLAVIFTASRSAWVALAIGLMVYAMAIWRFRLLQHETWISRHAPRVMAGATSVLVLSVGMLSVYATARDVRYYDEDSYVETVLYTLNLRAPAQERLKGRLAFWSAAGSMIAERPLFGIGIGRFFKDVSAYVPDPAALPRQRENAHNYFLQIAAEVGLIGLTALTAVLLAAMVRSSRVVASQGEASHIRHLALAVPIAIVVYLLTWTTGHP